LQRIKLVDAPVESLVTGQRGKPRAPMRDDIIIDTTMCGVTLQMPEDVHGQQFFVRKTGLEVARTLMFQDRFSIVEAAD
jgi:hypothetical protein